MFRQLLAITVALVITGGCTGGGSAKKPCYPVKGQLLVQGKPAEGAMVIFRPKENADSADWSMGFPHATTGAEGKFELGTYGDNDGAPAGDYVVLVSWFAPNPNNEEASGPDRLGSRYVDPATSKLSAKVEAHPTEIPPINLQ